jgi:inhibitor of KinA sporulation pathway (predicted exonuclease)
MKFNTNIIVLDLETTDCEDHSIIDIGAVMLDKSLNVVDTYKSLVKPYAVVSDFVTSLTGYTNDGLVTARPWNEVSHEWEVWASSRGNLKNCRLACWGNYFDVNVLRNNYAKYGLTFPFSGTVYDVKTAATMWLSLSGRRTEKISVEKMAKILNIKSEGKYHTAFTDAQVTALIFKEVMASLAGGVWLDGKYVEVNLR